MKMSKNPWQTQGRESDNSENPISEQQNYQGAVEFEDNFTSFNNDSEAAENKNIHNNDITPLPDSESYLEGLERKLQKIKKGSKLVEALAEKRQDCLRSLLNEQSVSLHTNEALVELDTPIDNADSTVQEIFRHLQPIQPITIGETVNIVKYDQLEEQREAIEKSEEENDSPDK